MDNDIKTISIPTEIIKEASDIIKEVNYKPKNKNTTKTKKKKKNGLTMAGLRKIEKIDIDDMNDEVDERKQDDDDVDENDDINSSSSSEVSKLKNLLNNLAQKNNSNKTANKIGMDNKPNYYSQLITNGNNNHYGKLEQSVAYASTVPKWGCLKNGNLPTFRTFRRLNHLSSQSDSSENKGYNHASFDIAKMLDTTPEPIVNVNGKLGVLSAPNISTNVLTNIPLSIVKNKKTVEEKLKDLKEREKKEKQKQKENMAMIKKTIKRSYPSGYSSSAEQINIIINPNTLGKNKTVKINPFDGSNIESLNKMRSILIKKGVLRADTSATPQIIRTMYHSLNGKDEVIVNSL